MRAGTLSSLLLDPQGLEQYVALEGAQPLFTGWLDGYRYGGVC